MLSLSVLALSTLALGAALAEAPAARPPAFPLKVSANRRYLVDQRGKPFFLMGDTPWFLQKVPMEDVRLILDDRKAKGYNTLFLELLDDSDIRSIDAYGERPFDPELDIAHPREAFWRNTDRVLEECARRGFFVIMNSIWYGAGEGLWMHHITPESARAYGHFLGRRYARFKNLMWMHVGDRNPDERLAECARQIALAIRQEAPNQLHTVHLAPGFPSASLFGKETWLDVDMAYSYAASYPQVLKEYQRTDTVRPVVLGETGYEDEPNAIELLPDARKGDLWNPYRIRRQAYWAALSGACGYCAGTRLWRYEPNWKQVLQVRSVKEAPNLLRLLAPRSWWRLVPDADHTLVTAGYGTWGQADYATVGLAEDGSFGLAYLPSPRAVTVDLGKLQGPVTARWFDPTDGSYAPIAGLPFPNRGSHEFTPPSRNAAGEPDFVLVLEAGKTRG